MKQLLKEIEIFDDHNEKIVEAIKAEVAHANAIVRVCTILFVVVTLFAFVIIIMPSWD